MSVFDVGLYDQAAYDGPFGPDLTPRIRVWPIQSDLRTYLLTWLTADYPTVPVGATIPGTKRPDWFVRVWRNSGRLNEPLVYLTVMAPDPLARIALAGEVHTALLQSAGKCPGVIQATDQSFPTETLDTWQQPVLFGSVSLLLSPY